MSLPVVILSLFFTNIFVSASKVTVQTQSGPVMGSAAKFHGLHRNGSYISFQGIPYAAAPVGNLRFKDPVAVEPWINVVDASGGAPAICPQIELYDPSRQGHLNGDENCLFLNIYTPQLPTFGLEDGPTLRPVMLFIHGGAFTFGSGTFLDTSGEDFFMENEVVLVTFNYRLGALGFMAIKGTSIQGNMGLKDQVEALRWVKKNVAKFGGDPKRITIFGQSAGGESVHAHVLSPVGKGENLFHRAIALSGSSLMYNYDKWDRFVEQNSRRLYAQLCRVNITDTDLPKNLTETCLHSVPVVDILNITTAHYVAKLSNLSIAELIPRSMERNIENLHFRPILDPWADDPFLPRHPITVLTNKQQKMVPFMSGITKDEGAYMLVGLPHKLWKDMAPKDNQLQEHWNTYGPLKLQQVPNMGDVTYDDSMYAEMIAQFYVGKDGIKRENKQGLIDMFTDLLFMAPLTESMKLHALSQVPVYKYKFSYRGSASLVDTISSNAEISKWNFGVCHYDDVLYLFRMPLSKIITKDDIKTANIYQKLLINFARYGKPTPFGGDSDIPEWHAVQTAPRASIYMDINPNPEEKYGMAPVRMEFWNRILYKDLVEKYTIHTED